jgi:hypothetical protein
VELINVSDINKVSVSNGIETISWANILVGRSKTKNNKIICKYFLIRVVNIIDAYIKVQIYYFYVSYKNDNNDFYIFLGTYFYSFGKK